MRDRTTVTLNRANWTAWLVYRPSAVTAGTSTLTVTLTFCSIPLMYNMHHFALQCRMPSAIDFMTARDPWMVRLGLFDVIGGTKATTDIVFRGKEPRSRERRATVMCQI